NRPDRTSIDVEHKRRVSRNQKPQPARPDQRHTVKRARHGPHPRSGALFDPEQYPMRHDSDHSSDDRDRHRRSDWREPHSTHPDTPPPDALHGGQRTPWGRVDSFGAACERVSQPLLGPGHYGSFPSALASAASPRAAADLTEPLLMPSVAAISASDRPR